MCFCIRRDLRVTKCIPVRPGRIRQKVHGDTLRQTCVFASGGICGWCSAFWNIWGMKCQHILKLWWARCGLHKKHAGTHSTQLVFLHPVACAGHIVICDADTTKTHRDTLRQTCVFPSGGICGSCRAFRCVWGMKC
jgi:hypothetical protein